MATSTNPKNKQSACSVGKDPPPRRSSFWRTLTVSVLGFGTLLAGVAMLVLPGPAIVFIPLGLAILATEFRWAKSCLIATRKWIRDRIKKRRGKKDQNRPASFPE